VEKTMPKTVELDTFLVTLKVPRDLPNAAVARIRRRLGRPAFRARLHRAVEALLRRYTVLAPLTPSVSR
jgi:hypothetical protein